MVKRITTPLFGAGLIEAIDDDTIELNARRRQPDGVRGRVSRVLDVASGTVRVGRFGWKAQQASLLAFSGDAYLNEMGVTSRLFPTENAPNGRADLLAKFDLVPDIEDTIDPATGKSDIDHAADFMRFLAPPPPLRPNADALAGARIFEKAACTACHTPVMFTGSNPVAALSHRAGAPVLRPAAARHGQPGRRHRTGRRQDARNAHRATVGPARPHRTAARRQGEVGDRGDHPARRRRCGLTPEVSRPCGPTNNDSCWSS